MTVWIGLTGGIGSGKSQAAAYFAQCGVPIIDADAVNRELINTPNGVALQRIQAQFGTHMIDVSGCLKRDAMRQLIFQNPQAKQQLEQILHPLIIAEIVQQQKHFTHAYGLVELPILRQGSAFFALIQRVLLIHADEATRTTRVQQRNGLALDEIRRIMANQPSDAERLAMANDVIYNAGSLKNLLDAVQAQHQIYQQLFDKTGK